MSIALYDADRIYALKNKKPIPPPNFQLMKLSTYLNRQREMVSFISDLSRAPYYEKIYYFQEDISIPFASEIVQYENIELCGYAVNKRYKPMKKEVEQCPLNPMAYIHTKSERPIDNKNDKTFSRGQHILLSDGTRAYPYNDFDFEVGSTLYIHDHELPDNWTEELPKYLQLDKYNTKRSIVFCYPIIFSSLEELRPLFQFYTSKTESKFQAQITCLERPTFEQLQELQGAPGKNWLDIIHFQEQKIPSTTEEAYDLFIDGLKSVLWCMGSRIKYKLEPPVMAPGLGGWHMAWIYIIQKMNRVNKVSEAETKSLYDRLTEVLAPQLYTARPTMDARYAIITLCNKYNEIDKLMKCNPKEFVENGGKI